MEKLGTLMEEITGIFAERFETKLDSPEMDLLETGIVDSVRIVELVLELEQRFGVSLDFEALEIEDFRTVARLAERVQRNAPTMN